MSALGGSALVGGVVFAKELWHYWKPRKVGVYGPTMVGKTTLDRYMTTPGEMEEIPLADRTKHFKVPGINRFLLPRPSRKRVTYKGDTRVVYSSDIGGEERFWNLWVDDLVNRQVEAVIFLIDHRSSKGGEEAVQAVGGFKYLVDAILHRQYRYRKLKAWFKGKKYAPKLIMLVANKADQWWDDQANVLWQQQRLGEHKIFDPFREDLVRLQKAGVPTKRGMMATKIGWNVENTMLDLLS
tara:strand:+ start:2403 stop:3122 length:720 start_codon:yes stop_codon:yes gene_type:complete